MKKSILIAITTILTTLSAFAEWQITFAAGQFYFSDGTPIQKELNFAVIVDMNKKGFADLEFNVGDFFERGKYINSDNDYMTLATGTLSDADGEGYYLAYSNSTWNFKNEDFGFANNEEAAIVVWYTEGDSQSYTLAAGDFYTIGAPSLAGGELSEADPWVIPSNDSGKYQWYLLGEGIEGKVPDSLLTLSQTVSAVPEPSTYAAIFGAVALGFAAYRRRK